MKIAHEAPKSIFSIVQKMTDYDYALVHLFGQDAEYLKLFQDAVASGREVILDNSIFELGTAFDMKFFMDWVVKLKPTWYIVPDALEDFQTTVKNMSDFLKEGYDVPGCKTIGVIQGKNYQELADCYRFMVKVAKVHKVAIPFDLSYYEQAFPHPDKLVSWTFGRIKLINDFIRDGIIDKSVPHHLLGCALPIEGKFYDSKNFDFIDSVDTSNPVVHGILRKEYQQYYGLSTKDSVKLYTMIDSQIDYEQEKIILGNIEKFSEMWNTDYFAQKR